MIDHVAVDLAHRHCEEFGRGTQTRCGSRNDWVKVVDSLPVQRSSTAFEFHPELFQFGPDFMYLRGCSGNEDLRPSSVVIGAGAVVHHRLLQGVPVLFTVVILIDEHPDLVIRTVGRLPEPGTRPGVVVDLGMRALIVEYLGEELQRLAMIGLGDAEFHSVDLRHCRLPSDVDTRQGIREPAEQRPFRGAKPDCGLLDPAVFAGHSNGGVAVGADALVIHESLRAETLPHAPFVVRIGYSKSFRRFHRTTV